MSWYLHAHYNKAKKRIVELEEMLTLKVEAFVEKDQDEVIKILKKRAYEERGKELEQREKSLRTAQEQFENWKQSQREKLENEFNREKETELTKLIYSQITKGVKKLDRYFHFEPRNELSVLALFVKYEDYLGFKVKRLRSYYPDCIAIKDGKEVRIELEYASGNFTLHKHDPVKCDLVVCWIKDRDIPIDVLELSSKLTHFRKG